MQGNLIKRVSRALLAAAPLMLGLFVSQLPLEAQTLRGSTRSMDHQVREARKHGFAFIYEPGELPAFVEDGRLVTVRGNQNFRLKEVSYPYSRPEVLQFVELLAERYKKACKELLVVTSLTRPITRQPRNASSRSVHPTGMALDVRRSWTRACRNWLEQTLLTLEAGGVLEAALEWDPAHYHIALFPKQYREYGARILATGQRSHIRVARGDTLWRIASRNQTSVGAVKKANGLRSNQIYPGQILRLPTSD